MIAFLPIKCKNITIEIERLSTDKYQLYKSIGGRGLNMSITALWAKKAKEGAYWLPLEIHLRDTAEIAKKLWDEWLPDAVKRTIADSVGGDEQEARKLFIFLAIVHDIGKATPVFQAKRNFWPTDLDFDIYNKLVTCGLNVKESREEYRFYQRTPHALASQLLLEYAKDLGLSDANLNRNAAVILGSHHGKPPDRGYNEVLYAYETNFGIADDAWKRVQSELIQFILELSGYGTLAEVPSPLMPGQVLLSGLIIIADWIASDTAKLPLLSFDWQVEADSIERAQGGWEKLKFSKKWEPYSSSSDAGLYAARFDQIREANKMQKAALNAVNSIVGKPGIMVIEAPMGLGKTEAALVVAEIFSNRTNCSGIFFALPTQATSDGIFPRLLEWMGNLELPEPQTVKLAHGKAQFNKDYAELQPFASETDGNTRFNEENDYIAIVHDWFNGRKKAMLANFVVGTIDQLLLMALKQKHVMLRHLGLAGKVVIIDECHAYDAYMNQYLKRALTWLGAYGVPVIVLSATLPMDTRRAVIEAYLGKDNINGEWAKSQDYPLITYTDDDKIKSCPVELESENRAVIVERLLLEDVAGKLEELLSGGGCAGIIMDTVKRAQDMARIVRGRFNADAVLLIHSRFIIPERMAFEEKLRHYLGKNGTRPDKLIVIGTQVLEQSLDIDFDIMITDIAPMDLLLQRIGRLHRHNRSRPEKLSQPICYVTGIKEDGFEQGIDRVYDLHLLNRTKHLLDNLNGAVSLPKDIARLVNAAYDKNTPQTPEKEAWEKKIQDKEDRADSFRMKRPMKRPDKTLVDWLNTDVDDKKGEASVRDSYDAVEVLVIKKLKDGFSMMNGVKLPEAELDNELAKQLACQSVSLPRELSNMKVIEELRDSTNKHVSNWQSSTWIAGELFLILDENNSTILCGRKVTYTSQDGLCIEKEDAETGNFKINA